MRDVNEESKATQPMGAEGGSAWLDDLRATDALLSGHFALTSGRHSDTFLLLPRLVAHTTRLVRWLDALVPAVERSGAGVVGGPALGAVALAWALAHRAGGDRLALYAEKTDEGSMAVRRGFGPLARHPVFLVEDAMTTGGSLLKARAAFEAVGSTVVAVGVLVDRRSSETDFPLPVTSVLRLPMASWPPDACPLCRAGTVPLVHPKQLA